MDFRRILHPLPLAVMCIFVVVAIADLVEKLTEAPTPPPELAAPAVPRFEALEPVIDFRRDRESDELEVRPIPELAQEQWSAPRRSGVWARSAKAEFEVDLASGGYRLLVLECATTKKPGAARSLRLSVNGENCGKVLLEPGWKRYRFTLPEGSCRAGSNKVVFSFPNTDGTARTRREILVRRVGWFFDEKTDVEALDAPSPASLDIERERVTIRRSGVLDVPLVLSERTDALQMRYRFSSGLGSAELEVAKSRDQGAVPDVVMRKSLTADRQTSGRVRVPLHGRRGAYILRVSVRLAEPENRLLISSLRLVEEGDPTRRPWATDPVRN
jgi:hypothetical protein